MSNFRNESKLLLKGIEYDRSQGKGDQISETRKANCFSAAKYVLKHAPQEATFLLVEPSVFSSPARAHFMAGHIYPKTPTTKGAILETASITSAQTPELRKGIVGTPVATALMGLAQPIVFDNFAVLEGLEHKENLDVFLAVPVGEMLARYLKVLREANIDASLWSGAIEAAQLTMASSRV